MSSRKYQVLNGKKIKAIASAGILTEIRLRLIWLREHIQWFTEQHIRFQIILILTNHQTTMKILALKFSIAETLIRSIYQHQQFGLLTMTEPEQYQHLGLLTKT